VAGYAQDETVSCDRERKRFDRQPHRLALLRPLGETTDNAQVDGYITVVSARVSGTAQQVNFNNDDVIEKDQVLVQLDRPPITRFALERARAELAEAQRNAVASRTTVPLTSTTANSGVTTATARVASAERQASAAHARVREAQARTYACRSGSRADAGADSRKMKFRTSSTMLRLPPSKSSRATLDAAIGRGFGCRKPSRTGSLAIERSGTAPEQITSVAPRAALQGLWSHREEAVRETRATRPSIHDGQEPQAAVLPDRGMSASAKWGQAGVPFPCAGQCGRPLVHGELIKKRNGEHAGRPEKPSCMWTRSSAPSAGHVEQHWGRYGCAVQPASSGKRHGNYVKVVHARACERSCSTKIQNSRGYGPACLSS